MMEEVLQEAYRGFRFPGLARRPDLAHVFAGRASDGRGNVAYSGGRDREAAWQARSAWSRFLEVAPEEWVVGGQVHGTRIAVVDPSHRGRGALAPEEVLPACDGLITTTPGLPLYVAVADCGGILLHASGLLGVVHAGWRGLAAGILGQALERIEGLGVPIEEVQAGIAPCMAAPSYEVGPEVAEPAPEVARYRGQGDRWQVDIGLWARHQLVTAGMPDVNIELAGIDTGTDPRCFSHRREGVAAGRNGLIAVLR